MGANTISQKKTPWILFVASGQSAYNNEFEMSIQEFRVQKSPSFSIANTKNIIKPLRPATQTAETQSESEMLPFEAAETQSESTSEVRLLLPPKFLPPPKKKQKKPRGGWCY